MGVASVEMIENFLSTEEMSKFEGTFDSIVDERQLRCAKCASNVGKYSNAFRRLPFIQ